MTRAVKVGWHVAMLIAALFEYTLCKTRTRKLLCVGCAGYHSVAIVKDYKKG